MMIEGMAGYSILDQSRIFIMLAHSPCKNQPPLLLAAEGKALVSCVFVELL